MCQYGRKSGEKEKKKKNVLKKKKTLYGIVPNNFTCILITR